MQIVLTVKNNTRPEIIMSAKDFEDVIDKHMGTDCADYYHRQISHLTKIIEDLYLYVDEFCIDEDVEEVLKTYGF